MKHKKGFTPLEIAHPQTLRPRTPRTRFLTGFTLIETMAYLALFAIVIGGGMIAAYQIIEATNASYNHVVLQEEANFLLRKIDWALTGATSVCLVNGSTLKITKISPVSCSTVTNLLVFDMNGRDIRLNRGNAPPVTLNSSNVSVTNLIFTKTLIGNGITTHFTLTTLQNGKNATENFSTTKYLRQ